MTANEEARRSGRGKSRCGETGLLITPWESRSAEEGGASGSLLVGAYPALGTGCVMIL
jgi:hypothetical protein